MNQKTAIKRMKRGDLSGLEALVRRYEVEAVRTAFLITRDRALAEDVAQSAFLRAYQHIDQYDQDRPFAPWFMRSVVNAAIQATKRRQRELSLDEPVPGSDNGVTFAALLTDSAPSPDDEAEHADLRQKLWDALEQLTPEQRATIVLRYYLDYSDDEIAVRLSIPPGTVRWRLHAARKHLQGLLWRFGWNEE